MADFTADVSQLQSLQAELRSLASRAEGIASSVQSTGNSLGGIKSIANKGYPAKISTVRSAISKAAQGTSAASVRIGKIASTYSSCENAAKSAIADTQAGHAGAKNGASIAAGLAGIAGVVAGSTKRYMKVASSWIGAGKTALAETLKDLEKNWHDAGGALDDFRRWRSSKGSELVIAGAAILGDVPKIGGLLKNATDYYAEKWGKKAKKYEKIFDGVQATFNGLDHLEAKGEIDSKSADTAVAGFSAFASELGVPDFYAIQDKYNKRVEAIGKEANTMIKSGSSKSEAYAYAISGTVLTIGELCADTCFQAAKTFVKANPAVKKGLKVINTISAVATEDTLEGHIDNILGGVGNKLRSGLKPFASNFK